MVVLVERLQITPCQDCTVFTFTKALFGAGISDVGGGESVRLGAGNKEVGLPLDW